MNYANNPNKWKKPPQKHYDPSSNNERRGRGRGKVVVLIFINISKKIHLVHMDSITLLMVTIHQLQHPQHPPPTMDRRGNKDGCHFFPFKEK